MSSNIRISKICQYCGKEFEARKTTSRTCSDTCAKMLYKQRQREQKIESVQAETRQIKTRPMEELKAKEFLSVRDVAKLLNCSRQTVYDIINRGSLKATNLKVKKTIVRRSDLDKLFESPQPIHRPDLKPMQADELYTLAEVEEKYRISESALHQLINRSGIQREKIGGLTYVPKAEIDKHFS